MRYIVAFFFAFLLNGCAWAQPYLLEKEIEENFPDAVVQKSVRCITQYKEDFADHCDIRPEILNYRNEECDCFIPANIIEFFWEHGGTFDSYYADAVYFSPKMMQTMIAAGADYGRMSVTVVSEGSMDYFVAFVDSMGGPNGRMADGGIVLHEAIAKWDQKKIDYLRLLGKVDWEQRNTFGDTAILRGFLSGDENVSGFERTLMMIDYGADPRAVDNDGRGVCDYVRRSSPWENRRFPNERVELEERLRKDFAMDCAKSEVP